MIYFIKAKNSGTIKIGVSNDPKRRLETMQTGSPEPLELLGILPGGAEDERRLHRRFAQYRIHGEWFRGDPVLLRAIDALVRKPLAELIDEKGVQVWVIVGDVRGEDGSAGRTMLVCVFHRMEGRLFPDPDEMLRSCRPSGCFQRIHKIANVTDVPTTWPFGAERIREAIEDSQRSIWVYDFDGVDPFAPKHVLLNPPSVPVLPPEGFEVGARVVHPVYGPGEIIHLFSDHRGAMGSVNFTIGGEKTFVIAKSPLRVIDAPEVN